MSSTYSYSALSKMTYYVPDRLYERVGDKRFLARETWWLGSEAHRVDGPAAREWTAVNGLPVLTCEDWLIAGQRHRVDGPAFRRWKIVKGLPVLTYEAWWVEGQRHRVDGPAVRAWMIVKGLPVLTREEWWVEGQRHRVDGPAYRCQKMPKRHWLSRLWMIITRRRDVIYKSDPTMIDEQWWLEGKQVEAFALPCVRELTAAHLQRCGLVVWPGLMNLITAYLV